MSRRTVATRFLLAAAVVVGGLGLLSPGTGASAAPVPAPREYVALGDAFSAGTGLNPLVPDSPLACGRSQASFPRVLATYVGARLTDATCGGAGTKHLTRAQYPGVAPQLEALSARTDLVTLTLGGNDNAVFLQAVTACTALGLTTLGQGSPCRDAYGTRFTDRIDEHTLPALTRGLRQVHRAAPNARVAVLTYPWILPRAFDPACFPTLPVARGDVRYLRGVQARLNRAVRLAAERTGSEYVDTAPASVGHDACQRDGVRWVEPVLLTSQPVPVHLSRLGSDMLADQALRQLDLLAPTSR